MRMLFCGDIALNGVWMNNFEVFDNEVKHYLTDCDISLLNLETVIKAGEKPNPLKNPTLFTSQEAVLNLKNYGFSLYNLANNHVSDYLDEGFKKTVECIKEINGVPLGASLDNFIIPDNPYVIKTDKMQVFMLSYVDEHTNPGLKDDGNLKVKFFNEKNIKEDLQKINKEQNTLIIISVHWGFDNYKYPAPYQRNLAHLCIDLGADFIWGHHSHVIQPFEIYNDKYIFYCQGNACFDKVYNSIPLNKSQLQSFLIRLNLFFENGNVKYNVELKKFLRKSSTVSASFKDANFKISEIKGVLLNMPAYSAFYFTYKVRFYINKGFNYFFGYNRNPVRQFILLFSKFNINRVHTNLNRVL